MTLTKEGIRKLLREVETRDRDRQSGEGPYSVIKFFAESSQYARKWVTWEEACEAAQYYTSSFGAQEGALRRVIITDGEDQTVFEWKYGEGIVIGEEADPEVVRKAREVLNTPKPTHCSFCGKAHHEVKKFVAGPSVFICDECVLLMVEIMWGEEEKAT
jgi:hypothetical protein